jgi:predicted Zn-dependent protease
MSCLNKFKLAATLAALLSVAACATNPVTGKSDFVLMSEQQEIRLGVTSHADLIKQQTPYKNQALSDYVNRIGQRLAANSHRPTLRYHFTVLDSPAVNAFALPGGYVYITRGLMSYLNSEAELAAVLGHELGHVTARHGVRQYSAALATSLGYAIVAAGVPELQGSGAESVFNAISTSLLRGYGREHELEADRLGAEYLARTGYDPQAMIEVITVLKNQELFENKVARQEGREPQSYHGLFATHPSNDRRLQEVVGAANRFRTGNGQKLARQAYLDQLQGLVFGESAANGFQRGDTFYHPPLNFKVKLPADWRVKNHPAYLEAFAPDNTALMRLAVDQRKPYTSPEYFIRRKLKQDDKLRYGKRLVIDKLPAYTGWGQLSAKGRAYATRFTVLFYGERAVIFIGTIARRGQRDYDPDFLATATSFRRLTPEEKQGLKPLRIHVIKAKAGDSFAAYAAQSPVPKYAEEQLRLINDKFPAGEPRAGEHIKVIR